MRLTRRAFAGALTLLPLSLKAESHPTMPLDNWIVYGQTTIPSNSTVDNPAPNVNGLIGERSSLPFTVPAGKVLIIEAYGMESYENLAGGAALIPWIGAAPITNAKCLHTCYAGNASNEVIGADWAIPAGKVFNVRLTNAETAQAAYGWYVSGKLYDA